MLVLCSCCRRSRIRGRFVNAPFRETGAAANLMDGKTHLRKGKALRLPQAPQQVSFVQCGPRVCSEKRTWGTQSLNRTAGRITGVFPFSRGGGGSAGRFNNPLTDKNNKRTPPTPKPGLAAPARVCGGVCTEMGAVIKYFHHMRARDVNHLGSIGCNV